MQKTVTALTVQKRYTDRINVFLDGEFAFAVSLAAAATLQKGQQLDAQAIEHLRLDGEVDLAYQRSLRYLGYRLRSEAEISSYLEKKEFSPQVIEQVLTRLREKGYADDEEFARFWTENRNRFRPKGIRALRYELRQKGVAQDVIESVLAEQDDFSAAWSAIEGKVGRWRGLDKFDLQKKVMAYLSRRGFNYDVARSIFERVAESLGID